MLGYLIPPSDTVAPRAPTGLAVQVFQMRIGLGLNNPDLIDQLRITVRPDQMVLDLVGMSDAEGIAGRYCGICW